MLKRYTASLDTVIVNAYQLNLKTVVPAQMLVKQMFWKHFPFMEDSKLVHPLTKVHKNCQEY